MEILKADALGRMYTITRDTIIDESVNGSVTVSYGSMLQIRGTLSGTLIIEKGARVKVLGTFNGNVFNYGLCEISGVVNGAVENREAGISLMDPGAAINLVFQK